jgi:hypothetical protein
MATAITTKKSVIAQLRNVQTLLSKSVEIPKYRSYFVDSGGSITAVDRLLITDNLRRLNISI